MYKQDNESSHLMDILLIKFDRLVLNFKELEYNEIPSTKTTLNIS